MRNDLRHRERRDRYAGRHRTGLDQHPQPVREYDRLFGHCGVAITGVEDVCSGRTTRNDH